MTDLTGRAGVVTGAGTGIGRAVAVRLARRGARVALIGRTRAALEETAEACEGRAHVQIADVRDRTSVDDAFAAVATELGPLHVVVANAGIGGPDDLGEGDRWDDVVRTNLDGAYFTMRAFEHHGAVDAGPTHAVVVSSCVARFGVPGIVAYSAAKAGQLGLVRALAAEWAPRGVRVNAVCPGWVETQMAVDRMREMATESGTTYEAVLADQLSAVPLGRISDPDEIAGLVEYLVSDDAQGFTGQTFDLNNGAWMG